jgi:hypothetical protein
MADAPTPSSTAGEPDPIVGCLDRWHEFLRTGDAAMLDGILHDDCVFSSPIVFTPQEGKEVTKLYLTAAGNTLGGDSSPSPEADRVARTFKHPSGAEWDGRFRYARIIREGHHGVLEFETTISGLYVNGVDMITCDDDGRIVDFKVMIRPLQAVNAVHEQMKAMLESLSG